MAQMEYERQSDRPFFVLFFQCCLMFSVMPPEIVGEKMEPEGLYNAVNILISLQVYYIS